MRSKSAVVLAALALAMASTIGQAANINSTVAGGLWSAGTTWSGGIVPGETLTVTDVARIVNGGLVTLDYTPTYPLGNVQIGRTAGGAGNLAVTAGGVLNMTSGSNLEVGSQTVGTLLMSGGTINVLSALNITAAVAASGSSATVDSGNLNVGTALAVGKYALGTLTINGGSVKANTMLVGTNGINSFASLLGGGLELAATTPLTFNSAGSTLTIANAATLTLGGNQNSAIAGFASVSLNLLWNNGSSALGGTYGTGDQTFDNGAGSYLHSFYDSTATKTYVWVDTVAVPEPAALSLGLLGGIGLWVGRRTRRS